MTEWWIAPRNDVTQAFSPRHNFALMCTHQWRRHAGGVMISRIRLRRAAPLWLAAVLSMAPVFPAGAQTAPAEDELNASGAVDAAAVDINELDWSQLNVDASTLGPGPAAKSRSPQAAIGGDMSWSANDKPNGSAAVSVKQPLSPFWDARIGADMTVARQPTTMSELLSDRVANGGNIPQSSGTAWAAVTAPGAGSIWDKTAIEARVDPLQEQSKLGTSLSKSVPLSEQYSLTLQNGYDVIQQGIVPVPGHSSLPCADCLNLSATPARPARNYQTGQSAKLSIVDTGTSFMAGQTLSTTDDKWLRKIGAEQKLFDGVSVSGSIGETAQGATSRSISAGFKRSW